jgi:hypothetical protein
VGDLHNNKKEAGRGSPVRTTSKDSKTTTCASLAEV